MLRTVVARAQTEAGRTVFTGALLIPDAMIEDEPAFHSYLMDRLMRQSLAESGPVDSSVVDESTLEVLLPRSDRDVEEWA
jgi:uncharacterized protein YgbK (DUF1537 family)